MTTNAFYEVYEQDRRPHLKLNTWKPKEQMILTKILPYFGEMRMDQITPADILKWQAELLNFHDRKSQSYQPSYLRTINNQLTSMFNHAVRYYNLPVSPIAKADKMGKKKGREMQFWTKEEYERFSDAIMDKPLYFLAFEVLYWTGIREGELFALTPSDFDLKKKLLSVTRSYQRIDGQDVITDPKTPKSIRTVVMPEFLAEEAEEYLAFNPHEPDERIFTMSKSALYHEIDRGCKASGVKHIRAHDLRHSHASMLIEKGFSVPAIAARLGHSGQEITHRYMHPYSDSDSKIALALDGKL